MRKKQFKNISIQDIKEVTLRLFKKSRCGLVLLGPHFEGLESRAKDILNQYL